MNDLWLLGLTFFKLLELLLFKESLLQEVIVGLAELDGRSKLFDEGVATLQTVELLHELCFAVVDR